METAGTIEPRARASAARASYACAAATIVSLALGIGIVASMGVNSGAGVAQATQEARQSALPLLVLAEIMKLVTGVALAVAVLMCRRLYATSAWTAATGFLAAGLVFAAGLLGLVAVLSPAGAALAWPVVILGLLSLPLTGSWAAMTAAGARSPRRLRWLAGALGVAGFLSLAVPPVALLFGLLSIAWWVLLARQIRTLPK